MTRLAKWALALLFIVLSSSAWAQRVLVFPLDQAEGPASSDWIGTGLAVALDEALTRGGVLNIPLEDLRRYYDQSGLVESPTFGLPSQVGLARQLGAGVLVRGEYRVVGQALTVKLHAFGVAGDLKSLGQWEETQNLEGLLALTRKLGQELFGGLGRSWVEPPDVNPSAFESYIRGRIATDPTLQEVFFRKAVEIQPAYSDAWCCLAIVLKATGRVTESAGILSDLEKKSYPKAYLGLLTLADIRMDEGRLAEARRLLLASLKAAEGPEAHIGLAKLYFKQKKTKEALTELVVAETFGTHHDEIDALRKQIQPAVDAPS